MGISCNLIQYPKKWNYETRYSAGARTLLGSKSGQPTPRVYHSDVVQRGCSEMIGGE